MTDFSTLSDKPLRVRVCELLGWTNIYLAAGIWRGVPPEGSEFTHHLPPLELSADAVLPILIAECEKRGFDWLISGVYGHGFACKVYRGKPNPMLMVDGSTPAEALARALGVLLEGGK